MRTHVYYIIGLVFLACVVVLQCESQKKEIENIKSKSEFEKGEFTKTINELGLEVNAQKRIVTSSKRDLKEAVEEVNGLRKIKSQFKATVKAEIKNIEVAPVTPPVITVDTAQNTYMLGLPQSYADSNKYYSIRHTINKEGKSIIDSVNFMIYLRGSVGDKDKGKIGNLFKRREHVLTLETGSPHVSVIDMSNISYEKPKQNIITKAAVLAAVFFIGRSTK